MTGTRRILVLFAHPNFYRSRVHRRLVGAIRGLPGLTLHDLYESYPDFDVDVKREQGLLEEHDTLILQHPFYWYSTPPLVKQWFDLVLEYGWAYGEGGTALAGKRMQSAITTGGEASSYGHEGPNRHTVEELLSPIAQTARLCGFEVLPPFVVHGTHALGDAEIARSAEDYRKLVLRLRDGQVG